MANQAAVTDDRSWTVRHQSKWQLRIRRYLGRREREYEPVEDSDA